MTFSFDPRRGLVIVRAEIWGPTGSGIVRLALDTGATETVINAGPLVAIGCDPSLVPQRSQVTTGSGVEFVPRLPVERFMALGIERAGFPVLCHTLPPSAGVDGLLGLDFVRGYILTVNLRDGLLNVE